MGQALSMPIRQKIAYLNEQGTSYLQLKKDFKVAYNTIRNLCRAYKDLGIAGLQPKYGNCGNKGKIRSSTFIHRCCIFLRKKHPSWGADTIHGKIAQRFPDKELPDSRTMHRWLVNEGLIEKKRKHPRQRKSGQPMCIKFGK